MSDALTVGFAGLGRMGTAISRNLARAGLLMGVWNRTPGTAQALAAELGVPAFATPAELAAATNAVITMVADGAAVEAVHGGPDGIAAGIRPGSIAVEMSTIGPDPLPALAQALEARGATLVDAPVSGSTAVAERAELTFMAGGTAEDVERLGPVFQAAGRAVHHMGPLGAGATMKLAVNNVVYAINQTIAESLVLAERAGIQRERAYGVFADSAVAAPIVHYRRGAFERPDETPVSFRLALAAKDLDLILGLAARVGQPLPQAEANAQVLQQAMQAGLADADVSAVAQLLRGR